MSRIVMVGPCLDAKGGIASSASLLVRYSSQSAAEHSVIYVASSGSGECSVTRKVGSAVRGYWRFWSAIRERPHIVHVHTASGADFWRNTIYLLVAKVLRLPCILHVHPAWSYTQFVTSGGRLSRWTKLRILSLPGSFIVPSPSARSKLSELVGARRIDILPNPIETAAFCSNPLEERTNLIVFLGWMVPRKGVTDLLQAVKSLIRSGSRVRLELYGPYCSESVRDASCEPELQGIVTVGDWVSGKAKIHLLSSARILALPSYTEGFPVVLLEAMASGLPCVATRVGGIPDMISNGVSGILVPPGSPDELAGALETLLHDDPLWRTMSENCRRAAEMYDISSVCRTLAIIYQERGRQEDA